MISSGRIIYLLLFVAASLILFCTRELPDVQKNQIYLNLDPNVNYIGMHTCRSCHDDIHATFIHTGMGRSFDEATREKSGAIYNEHSIVYDKISDFYYRPFFRNDSMFISEFRLENGDTIHQRVEHISYIVGSGQHTNSHILDINGYIYQAPITFYTQEGRWDMAPGFSGEGGFNERFGRLLNSECITCHNHLPKLAEGGINKFEEMPRGIECERCHGPGALHAKEKLAGNLVDTATQVDYTIVNPSTLPRDLQMDLCQRCHLQGIAVLEEGKTFYDFRPGMALNEVMNVFLPRYTNSHEKFIMASQADRLRLSACYLNSDMTCITCHNPHKSVQVTGRDHFNEKCQDCHQQQVCSLPLAEREAENNDCSGCHMPPSGSIDIPHVRITDHYISKGNTKIKKALSTNTNDEVGFLGLQILTKEKASPLEMAKGYLAMYDKYVQAPIMLDSAGYYLQKSTLPKEQKLTTSIHYFFAKTDYQTIISLAAEETAPGISDAWTAYRIGEAYFKLQNFEQAIQYLDRACELQQFNLDFQEKRATVNVYLGRLEQAEAAFNFVLSEHPRRPVALCNLGYIQVLKGKIAVGAKLYDQALALDPDYEQALINKAALYLYQQKNAEARALLDRVLEINPNNAQASAALQQMR